MKKVIACVCILMLAFVPMVHRTASGKPIQANYQADNQATHHEDTVEPNCNIGNQQPPVRE